MNVFYARDPLALWIHDHIIFASPRGELLAPWDWGAQKKGPLLRPTRPSMPPEIEGSGMVEYIRFAPRDNAWLASQSTQRIGLSGLRHVECFVPWIWEFRKMGNSRFAPRASSHLANRGILNASWAWAGLIAWKSLKRSLFSLISKNNNSIFLEDSSIFILSHIILYHPQATKVWFCNSFYTLKRKQGNILFSSMFSAIFINKVWEIIAYVALKDV